MIGITPQWVIGITGMRSNPWVFANGRSDGPLSHLSKAWYRVRERAGVHDVRIHDLRHSFASRALALGESLTMIGRLLGHTDSGSTERYAHLERDAEKASAAMVGSSIEADIAPARAGTAPGEATAPGSSRESAA